MVNGSQNTFYVDGSAAAAESVLFGRGSCPVDYGFVERWDFRNVPTLDQVAELSALFRAQYGNNYHHYVLHQPEVVRRMIAHGEWSGFVYRLPCGELVGHGALLPTGNRCVKFARALVSPKSQGLGIHGTLTKMRFDFLSTMAASDVLSVTSTDAVTSHATTQRAFEGRGFFPVGIYLGKFTDYFATGARESVVRYQYLFDPRIKRERTLFAPQDLWPIIDQIASWSGCERRLRYSARPTDHDAEHSFIADLSEFLAMGSIHYQLLPLTSVAPLLRDLEQQITRGVQFVSVAVSLCNASACEQIAELRSWGFSFGGVEFLPYGDILNLQWSASSTQSLPERWAPLEPLAKALMAKMSAVKEHPGFS